MTDLFDPTEEHAALRRTMREFMEREVDPQAAAHDRSESLNLDLFRKLGDLGVLGVTVPEKFGGAGMDAVAAVLVHEELAAADPGFTLAHLAHSMLFVNNFYQNASDAQRARYLTDVCSGRMIGGGALEAHQKNIARDLARLTTLR
jgi:isovaleryl-CoA dehydrogenase